MQLFWGTHHFRESLQINSLYLHTVCYYFLCSDKFEYERIPQQSNEYLEAPLPITPYYCNVRKIIDNFSSLDLYVLLQAAIFVFALSSRKSFENIRDHLSTFVS